MYQAIGAVLFHLIIIFFIFEKPFLKINTQFLLAMSHQVFLVSLGAFSILMFLISFYFLIKFLNSNNIFHIILTGLFFGFSMLAKIQVIFLFLTIFIALPFLINYLSASDRFNNLIENSKLLG